MKRKFDISNKYEKIKLFKKKTISLESGITVLVGCNGSGKTEFLFRVKRNLYEAGDIPCLLLDCKNNASFKHSASIILNSTGEALFIRISEHISRIRNFISKSEDESTNERWILFDNIDNGFSIDNISQFKDLLNEMLKDAKKQGIELFIVVTSNTYEMTIDQKCFDVVKGSYVNFDNYDDYKKFIIASAIDKVARDSICASKN